ncbi:MAG: DNA polymerase III subunit epsilon [Pseudomonadota bacterium]
MREICFDTETTGLDPKNGDRIIELGAVELENLLPTGREFHAFINPQRAVSADTIRITGITDDMLADKPDFSDPSVVGALMEFFGDAPLVAHNAEFDRAFLNAELERCGRGPIPKDRFVDTLGIARQRYPGASNTLDALCKRFDISIEKRDLHGAVIDSQLLAGVYLELRGGRARAFEFGDVATAAADTAVAERRPRRSRPKPLPSRLSEAERRAHAAFVDSLGENAIWSKFSS